MIYIYFILQLWFIIKKLHFINSTIKHEDDIDHLAQNRTQYLP